MSTYRVHDERERGLGEVGELYNPYDAPKSRPLSIDLALELEHQLGNESTPSTPANPTGSNARPPSLDPHILASIVMQLRHSLSEMTKDRDQLQHMLSVATSQVADIKDTLQFMEEKCLKLEEELDDAKKQMADDETAISLLRSKVEESRRGLMRLQAETKQTRRQSHMSMSVDLSRAGGGPPFGGPLSSKRASFTPLTGTSYPRPSARASSVSVSDSVLPVDGLPLSPPPHSFSFPDSNGVSPGGQPPPGSRLFSGLLGRTSPEPGALVVPDVAGEVYALRRELKAVKDELEETRHELTESNEAREASETCVKVLREFIGDNNVGGEHSITNKNSSGPVKLPSPPHVAKGDDPDPNSRGRNGSTSSWGFKLWSGGGGSVRASNSSSSTSSQPNSAPQPSSVAFAKFGGFFGSKVSASGSTTSSTHAGSHPQEPTYNGSDTSSIVESVAEPISPTSEMPSTSVLVRGDTLTGGSQSPSDVDGLRSHTDQAKGLNGDGHRAVDVLTR